MRPNVIGSKDVWGRCREDVYLALARTTGIKDTMVSRATIEEELKAYPDIYSSFVGLTDYQMRQAITWNMTAKYRRQGGKTNRVWFITEAPCCNQ